MSIDMLAFRSRDPKLSPDATWSYKVGGSNYEDKVVRFPNHGKNKRLHHYQNFEKTNISKGNAKQTNVQDP
jgi:hypothetical protein